MVEHELEITSFHAFLSAHKIKFLLQLFLREKCHPCLRKLSSMKIFLFIYRENLQTQNKPSGH